MAIVYMASNIENNKAYIGKTVKSLETRRKQHYVKAKSKPRTHFHYAIANNAINIFEWIILEEVPDNEVNESEMFWIAYFKSIGAVLYNHTIGGEGTIGYKHTDEWKLKLSQRTKVIPKSAEHLAKMIENHKGNTGKKFSKDHIAKITKQFAKTYILRSPNGDVVEIHSLHAFSKETGLDDRRLNEVYNGKRKSYKGWTKV